MHSTFDIVFFVNGIECHTRITAADWKFALKKFWVAFESTGDVEIFSINGEEKHEW